MELNTSSKKLPLNAVARRNSTGRTGEPMNGRKIHESWIPGGASTSFLTPEHLDVPMDYDPVAKVGSRLGTGTFMVFAEDDCPVRGTLNMQRFFARESCGFCTPCRDGLPYGVDLLQRIENGQGTSHDIEWLDELSF